MIARLGATAAWVATLAMGVATLRWLFATDFLRKVSGGVMDDAMIALTALAIVGVTAVTIAYETVGILLGRSPLGRRIALVLIAGGLCFAAIPLGYIVGGELVLHDPAGPLANALFLLGPAMIAPGYALILPVLALLFPTGRLPGSRWRIPAALATVLLAIATLITILRPGEIAGTASSNPFGVAAMPAWIAGLPDTLAGLGVVLLSMLGVIAVIARYRRGSAVERQQLRWFAAAVLLAAAPIAISPQPGIGGPQWLLLAEVGLVLVPVSVGIAVTRYRLYEIDRLISRGLSWAVLSGLLVAVYGTGVLVLQGLLAGVTQGETLAVAASTLLAAAVFQPLRGRVQRAMDRRFDRSRYDGERIATRFAARLRDEVAIEAVTTDLRSTVEGSVNPAGFGLWLRGSGT